MRFSTPITALGAVIASTSSLLVSASLVDDVRAETEHLARRGIVTPQQVNGTYDFIIAGGGLAGLVLASRLTEDSNKTVLVLEAGDTGYAVQHQIDVPGNAYYSSLLGTDYDWKYKTVAQAKAGGREMDWPRGKVLGGSTAVNGMYLVRPSRIEVDTFASLAGENGTEYWGWDSMFRAMKKSERFTPPSDSVKQQGNIEYVLENHGTNGPLDYAYPPQLVDVIGQWSTVLDNIGVAVSQDPNGGDGWGSFVATSAINPANWTRAYSRSAYIDPLPPRSNLHILANANVLNVTTQSSGNDGKAVATGVNFQVTGSQSVQSVTASQEVILSAGAIGSPQLLLLSGIGPKSDLAKANIASVIDLPGVGAHLQDHIATSVRFSTNATLPTSPGQNESLQAGSQSFASFVNSAISYVNATDLFGNWDATFKDIVGANLTWAIENGALPANSDPTVVAGYNATYTAMVDKLVLSKVGHVELLLWLTSTDGNGNPIIEIQAALQHPYSRGKLSLNENDVHGPPVIDPNYLAHPADVLVLREGLKLARKIGNTAPFSEYMTGEIQPGNAVSTDADWDAWLPGKISTEYHCSCSCSMMPIELGGVVGADLKVHGTENLRVVDASVFSIEYSAHLMAVTYGLAERAADLIKFDYMAERPSSTNSTSNQNSTSPDSPTGSAAASPSASTSNNNTSGAIGIDVGKSVLGAALLIGAAIMTLV